MMLSALLCVFSLVRSLAFDMTLIFALYEIFNVKTVAGTLAGCTSTERLGYG
jgi:hypothetical protein